MDQVAERELATCQICSGTAELFDVVDFNKNCEEARGHYLPLSGKPVYYHRCPNCAFVFAPELQKWSDEAFLHHIYNDKYVDIDPDYVNDRPLNNAGFLSQLFGEDKHRIRHLDYGGGNGILSAALRNEGWDSTSHDPFPSSERKLEDLGKFNLITAFEVFEHVPDVRALIANLRTLMDEECIVVFSTLLTDGHVVPNSRLTWWYASPRNGHISLFSKQSLVLVAQQHDLAFGSFNQNVHCLINKLPAWAEKLLK